MGLLTFKGGLHPYDGKELSKDKPITEYLPQGELVYPLSQHIGAPAVACVKKGDRVLVGQKIAEAGGFVSANIYSSVSGTVKKIEPRMTVSGNKVNSIIAVSYTHLLAAMRKLKGAYSLIVMSPRKLIGARDPFGFRPLCIGKRDNTYFLTSETCALDTVGAEFVRDVEPGEVVTLTPSGIVSNRELCFKDSSKQASCIFEYIYFARRCV